MEKVSVERLLPELENTVFHIEEQPYGSLFQLYKNEFLDQSVSKGLISPEALALAGDGYFSQPDCNIGWDSSWDCWYHGYDLYMLVASDSESDLPVFPLLSPASTHDSHGFLRCFFRMKSYDWQRWGPICREGRCMNHDGSEPSKYRLKYRCPLASRKYDCSCEHPCSNSKYGRAVHVTMKDNPRLFNIPPRDSAAWKFEYNARTSAERSNKRE